MKKDPQLTPDAVDARIFFVSDFLHFVSMTVLVFLRSSFGYLFFSPKGVFLVFAWAMMLFSIYAWNTPPVWKSYGFACVFSLLASLLYCMHLGVSVFTQIKDTAELDKSSGKSHILRITGLLGIQSSPRFEPNLHLWVEPALVFSLGLVLRSPLFGERHLSGWLIFAGPCLALKETLSYWHRLRQKKRQKDIYADTEDIVVPPGAVPPASAAPRPARKAAPERSRMREEAPTPDRETAEERHAEVLRLSAPATLEEAERSYRALIKHEHPDANPDSPEAHAKTVLLNEAIEYYRTRFGE